MTGRVVECPLCGTKMTIPPEYENVTARCRACNTVLNHGPQPGPVGQGSIPQIGTPAPQTSPTVPQHALAPVPCSVKSGILRSILWGVAFAAAGGVAVALLMIVVVVRTDYGAIVGSAGFGVVSGFLLGCVWGLVTYFDMPYSASVGIGAVLGLILSVTHQVLETNFLAPGDAPLYMTGLVGLGGGAFVGFVCAWFKNYRENEE